MIPPGPKVDGLNHAELIREAAALGRGGWPGKRKRGAYRAIERGDPKTIMRIKINRMLRNMAAESERRLYGLW